MNALYFVRTPGAVLVFAEHYPSDAEALDAARWLRALWGLPVTVVERVWRLPLKLFSGAVCDS